MSWRVCTVRSVLKLECNVSIMKFAVAMAVNTVPNITILKGMELHILLFSGYWADFLVAAILFHSVLRLRMRKSPACPPHVPSWPVQWKLYLTLYLPVYLFNFILGPLKMIMAKSLLCIIKHHTVKMYDRMVIQLHTLATSVTDAADWLVSHPGCCTPSESVPGSHLIGG